MLDAHSQGVRHGDIKSDNVMLAMPHREIKVNLFTVCIVVACFFLKKSKIKHFQLVDFGVAEMIDANDSTIDAKLIGTPNYSNILFFKKMFYIKRKFKNKKKTVYFQIIFFFFFVLFSTIFFSCLNLK